MTNGLLHVQELKRRIIKDTDKEPLFSYKAAQDLIAKANIDPLEIDMVILASATPDMPVASTEFCSHTNRCYKCICI
jgi:3-oxoacyl-[acyl-carrier-protein] synthase III